MAKLSPVFNDQTITANGDPAVGDQIFTYAAGSSTKQATFSDAAGLIPNTNPIIINSLGYPTQGPIWLAEGQAYKFVRTGPNDTDPPTSPIKTIDNVSGVGDNTILVSQWVSSGVTPTYVSTTSFTLVGDQTSEFHKGRMLQFTVGLGTVYGKIVDSVFTTLTTVTMVMESTGVLDSGLSLINLSILRADHPALPNPIELMRSTVAATDTATPLWDRAYGEVQDWTGTPTITDFPAAPQAGAQREVYPAPGTVITNAGNISVQGNVSYIVSSGDKLIITAVTTTTFYVSIVRKDGSGPYPPHFIDGLIATNNATDANNDIDIGIGYCRDSANTYNLSLSAAMTKRLDAAWAVGNNQGALDTGSKANSTWYYWFAIRRSDTGVVDVLASATAPNSSGGYAGANMPANYDSSRFLGATLTDGSGNIIAFSMANDRTIVWKLPIIDFNITSDSVGSLRGIRVPPVPCTAQIKIVMSDSTGTVHYSLVNGDVEDNVAPSPSWYDLGGSSSVNTFMSHKEIFTSSGQARTRTNGIVSALTSSVFSFKCLV